LEEDHQSNVAVISHSEWLPVTVYKEAIPLEDKENPPLSGRSTSSGYSSGQIPEGGHHLPITISEQGLPLQLFYCSRTNETSSDIGLHQSEQISSDSTFQNGRYSSLERYHRKRRLYVQDRSERCIRSSSNSQRFTTISGSRKPRYCIQLFFFSFRFEPSSESVHEINALCSRTTTSPRDKIDILFGRLLHTREIQKQDDGDGKSGDETPTRTWIPNQQGKECYCSEQSSRIFGVQDQFKGYEDFSSSSEDKQIIATNQTSREESRPIVPMDGVLTWQDHCSDSSNIRGPSSYSSYTTGPSKESASKSSSLGQQMYTDYQSEVGDPMVETQLNSEKWPANTSPSTFTDGSNNSCRRLRHRLGSAQPCDQQSWILDRKRKATLDQCQGADSDILCVTPPRKKLKGYRNQPTYGQHDSIEVCDEVGGNSFSNPTGFSSENSRLMQSSPTESSVSSRSGNKEYGGRPPQPNCSTNVRIINSKSLFQSSEETMGKTVEDRCVCSIPQPSTSTILEPTTRSVCTAERCVSTNLEEKRYIHVPTMEIDTTSLEKIEARRDQGSNSGNSSVDDTVLVSDAPEDETTQSTNSMEDKPMEPDRMALVNKKRKDLGMTEDLINLLNKASRDSTTRIYNSAWQKYTDWCKEHQRDPTAYNTQQVLKFLQAFSHFSPSTLNGYRSSIASVLRILYPNSMPLAEDPDIIDFFRAKRQCTITIPKLTNLETWDTDVLANYIKQNLSPLTELPLYELQQKLILLLCLHTMWRPRSDIGRLQFRDTLIRYSPKDQFLVGAVLHIRKPKEAQQKTIQLGLLQDDQQIELCVVRCLERFIKETTSFRSTLAIDHTLLLTHLNKPGELQPTSIQPKTAAAWVQSHMLKAGISKEYTAHSIRAASSTKAVQKGVSISSVEHHANWSQGSNTFEKYYYKPVSQEHESTIIQNSIFSTAENHTTSESEAKATRIVLGTTYNTQVAGAKDEEVVQTQPWFKRWFS
jgi:site-specific recombinase XerD